MATYANFFIEQGNSIPFRPDEQPLWTHRMWRLPNVYPEVRGTCGQAIYSDWAWTPSGLASGILKTYYYWASGFSANGRTLDKYSLLIDGLGDGSAYAFNANSFWLVNGSGDLLVGTTGQGGNFTRFLSPWTASGVQRAQNWGSGFWPRLRTLFDASGIQYPALFAIDNETFGDDVEALVVGGTGWFDRAKADPRFNTTTINGVSKLSDYIAGPAVWYDGTPIATGITAGSAYKPEDEQARHFYDAIYKMGCAYALQKGIAEPFMGQFGNIPVFNYDTFKSTSGFAVPNTYPNYPNYLANVYGLNAQAPNWYSDYIHQHDTAEDDVPPYWDSATGWIRVYPKPVSSTSNLDASGYAMLEYGKRKITQAYSGGGDIVQTVPWISIKQESSRKEIMKTFLRYCYNLGIQNFYVFEGDHVGTQATADIWYEIISDLNNYVDGLTTNTAYRVSTVSKSGGVYLKI